MKQLDLFASQVEEVQASPKKFYRGTPVSTPYGPGVIDSRMYDGEYRGWLVCFEIGRMVEPFRSQHQGRITFIQIEESQLETRP